MSTGEQNLWQIVQRLQPQLHEGAYVFCTVESRQPMPSEWCVMMFCEAEGTTIILRREHADELGLNYEYVSSWITLQVHSALSSVGLTAVFSTALTAAGISCNVVAGYYHDHLFVPEDLASAALQTLSDLSASPAPDSF